MTTLMVDAEHEIARAHELAVSSGKMHTLILEGVEIQVAASSNLAKLENLFWRSYFTNKKPVGPCWHTSPEKYDCTMIPRLRAAAQAAPGKGLDHLWVSLLESAAARIEWLEEQLPFMDTRAA